MPYIIAFVLFAAFTANVVIGAVGDAPPVNNVVEALIMFGAAIAFSVGILRSEAREQSKQESNTKNQ